LESIPYRVVTSSRRTGLSTGSGSHEVSCPFDDVTRVSPSCGGSSTTTAVPLSGFLGLSAVSWHTRASRPCFMPLPPVGFSLQSVAPRLGSRPPSRARSAPLQSSTAVPEVRCARSRPPGFTDSRADARWPGSPPELGRRFHRDRSRDFPDALDPTQRAHPVPAASSASKPSSPCESVPTRPRFRDASRPVLSWALPLQSVAPLEPRVLSCPGGPFRPPRASTATTRVAIPPPPGEAARPRGRDDLVGVRPAVRLRVGTCRLSATTLPPSTLGRSTVTGRP
jgi:hypothetical protein